MSLKENVNEKSRKTILRQAHKKSYTVITNKLAQDNTLSLRARGLMLYLLSLPDDWQIHINQLVKILKEGRCVISNILQELKEAKYIHHHKMGFKEGWQYFVFESPTQDDAFKEFLRTIQVCEEFANPNCSENTPPLQSTKSTYTKDPSSFSSPSAYAESNDSSNDSKKSLKKSLPFSKEKKEGPRGGCKTKYQLKKEQIPLFQEMRSAVSDGTDEVLMIIIRTNGPERIRNALQALKMAKDCQRPIRSHVALLRHLIKNAGDLPNEHSDANRLYALAMIEEYGLNQVKLRKTSVFFESLHKDISLSLQTEIFRKIFDEWIDYHNS